MTRQTLGAYKTVYENKRIYLQNNTKILAGNVIQQYNVCLISARRDPLPSKTSTSTLSACSDLGVRASE